MSRGRDASGLHSKLPDHGFQQKPLLALQTIILEIEQQTIEQLGGQHKIPV